MRLPVFALFERSLRVETRSVLMSLSRAGLLVVMLFLLIPVQSMARMGVFGAPGLQFFGEMVWINFVFITLAGLSYFSSAITEEKEEMMLGLLRMTDLNPIAILLGKSTSRLIGAFLLLIVQVPFVLLAVTLGGVGPLQILAAYSALLAYLFFLCNLALLFSVIFRNTSTAAAVTLGLVLLFFMGPYWAAGIEQDLGARYKVNLLHGVWPMVTKATDLWREATPSERLAAILRTGFTGPVVGFQVLSNLVMGVILFLLAWAVFDLFTRTERDAAPRRLWFFRRKSRRSRIPRRLLGARAITWKDFTFITGGKPGLLLKFGIVALLIVFFNVIQLESGQKLTREFEGGVLLWTSLFVTAIWLSIEASRIFKDEVRWKTLSSLMGLPISVPELAYRKAAGALAGTLPLLAGFAIGVLMVPDKVADFFGDMLADKTGAGFGAFVLAALQYILFLHLTAFLSLVIKRGALPLAIGIQYVGGMVFIAMTAFMFGGQMGGVLFLACLVCIGLTIPLHFGIGMRLARLAAEE